MTSPAPQPQEQPIDPSLFEVICAKEWFEKYGAQMMPGYFEARISAYKRIEKEKSRSRPAPSPSPCEENGCTDIDNCDEICDHSRVYSPVQMREAAAQAREKTILEIWDHIKGHCDPMTEDYLESLRTEVRK